MRSEISVAVAAADDSTGNDLSHLPHSLPGPRPSRPRPSSSPTTPLSYQILPRLGKGSLARLHFNFSWMPCPTLPAHSGRQIGGEGELCCLRPPSVRRHSLYSWLPIPRRQAQGRKDGREERRGHQRLFPPLLGRRLPSHPPSRIARISGIFPPPTITGVDNASNGGGGGGALWFFLFISRPFSPSQRKQGGPHGHARSPLSLLIGCCSAAMGQGHVFCPLRISGLLTIVIMFGGVLAA